MNVITEAKHPVHAQIATSREICMHTAALRKIIATSVSGEVSDQVVLQMIALLDQIDEGSHALHADVERARLDNFQDWVDESLLANDGRRYAQMLKLTQLLAAQLPEQAVDDALSEIYTIDEQDANLASILQHESPDLGGPMFDELARDLESLAEQRLQLDHGGYGSLQISASALRAIDRNRSTVNSLCAMAAGLRTATVHDLPYFSERFRVCVAASIYHPQPKAQTGGQPC